MHTLHDVLWLCLVYMHKYHTGRAFITHLQTAVAGDAHKPLPEDLTNPVPYSNVLDHQEIVRRHGSVRSTSCNLHD
jgi:hypothetical protein